MPPLIVQQNWVKPSQQGAEQLQPEPGQSHIAA
jgi:hypothetical protein